MEKRFKEKFRRNKCEIINSIPPNEYSDKVGLRGARYQVYKLLSKVNGGLYLFLQQCDQCTFKILEQYILIICTIFFYI